MSYFLIVCVLLSYSTTYPFPACAHCLDCPTDGKLDGKCLLCEDGYVVNDDGTCQPCINTEKDEVTCKACANGKIGRFFKEDACLCK